VIAVSNVTLFSAFTGTVCFQTACPTIAGTVAKAPAYTRCDTGAPGEFASGEVMCLGFGQAPVPAWTSTWGAVKSLYRE